LKSRVCHGVYLPGYEHRKWEKVYWSNKAKGYSAVMATALED
jgi:hypothetical protein